MARQSGTEERRASRERERSYLVAREDDVDVAPARIGVNLVVNVELDVLGELVHEAGAYLANQPSDNTHTHTRRGRGIRSISRTRRDAVGVEHWASRRRLATRGGLLECLLRIASASKAARSLLVHLGTRRDAYTRTHVHGVSSLSHTRTHTGERARWR